MNDTFVVGKSYRIVGVGVMQGDEKCMVSEKEATGYIEVNNEMVPVDLKLFGPGQIGAYAVLMAKNRSELKELKALKSSPDTQENILEGIAKKVLRVETLKTRNSDRLDFYSLGVWTLRESMKQAYLAGQKSVSPS